LLISGFDNEIAVEFAIFVIFAAHRATGGLF
jgi:hypothetical protein